MGRTEEKGGGGKGEAYLSKESRLFSFHPQNSLELIMHDTAERVVSVMLLLVCWLFAGLSQCKVMQTVCRQVVHASRALVLAQPRSACRPTYARLNQAWTVQWSANHAVTLLLREEREERERDNGQMAGAVNPKM